MEGYRKVCILGHGAYGSVYKVKCLRTGEDYALKCFHDGASDTTIREISCLAALSCSVNVITMITCLRDKEQIYMLMKYAPYTLGQVIHNGRGVFDCELKRQVIPLSFVAHFSRDVANALWYMHNMNIVHRDIHPFNVLLTEDLTVKVADMGLARQASRWMSQDVMSEPYKAPELFVGAKGNLKYTCAIDMWSLGIMIVDAMEGRMVFWNPVLGGKKVSTHQLIQMTFCSENQHVVSSVMPNVMKCHQVKMMVFKLLVLHSNRRLMAHELLSDKEWSRVAVMTKEDVSQVKNLISSQE